MSVLRVVLVQARPLHEKIDHKDNPLHAAELLSKASKYEPDVVVFPEYFPFHESRALEEAVADIGAYVVAGLRYVVDGTPYNTATIYRPDGSIAARQGKRYIGRLENRLWGFRRWTGDYIVLDIGKAKLGVGVCADFWSFPEAAYELFIGGADVFINPSYMFSLQGHWIQANLSRSLDFYMPVVGVDMASIRLETKRYTYTGGGLSHVIIPPSNLREVEEWWSGGAISTEGWVRLKLGLGEEIAYFDIDVEAVNALRRDWWRRMRGVELDDWIAEARSRFRAAKLVRA